MSEKPIIKLVAGPIDRLHAGTSDQLQRRLNLSDFLVQQENACTQAVNEIPTTQFLATPATSSVETLRERLEIPVLCLKLQQAQVSQVWISNDRFYLNNRYPYEQIQALKQDNGSMIYGREYTNAIHCFQVDIPFSGSVDALMSVGRKDAHPHFHECHALTVNEETQALSFCVPHLVHRVEWVSGEIEHILRLLEETIRACNQQIESHNTQLSTLLTDLVQTRRIQLREAEAFLAQLVDALPTAVTLPENASVLLAIE